MALLTVVVAPGIETALAPNGVDTRYFYYSGACPGASLTFIGSMDYPSNIDAVLWFADEVLPRLRASQPQLRFRVVGSRPDAAVLAGRASGASLTGARRARISETRSPWSFLRSGGGTRKDPAGDGDGPPGYLVHNRRED
jgi:hypothetical protein